MRRGYPNRVPICVIAHDLARKLRNHNLRLYYVQDRSGTCAYLTEDPRPIQELLALQVNPSAAVKWKRTVRISQIMNWESFYTSDWGDYGYQIGNCLIFGDPVLLRQIEEILAKD